MNGPLTVVTTGSNINTTEVSQLITDTTIPFTKLDTQNIVSFQTISLLFSAEPPQPAALDGYTNTLVYQFPHGYNYIPSTWMQWQNLSTANTPSTPTSGNAATTFYPFGDDANGIELLNNILGLGVVSQPPSLIALTEYNNLGSIVFTTQASLITTADTTNVYISILKEATATISGAVIPLHLAGTTLNLRIYCFCEPSSTSTY